MSDLRSRIIEAALGVTAEYEGVTVDVATALWTEKASAVTDAVLAVLAPELDVVEAAREVSDWWAGIAVPDPGPDPEEPVLKANLAAALSRLGSVPEREAPSREFCEPCSYREVQRPMVALVGMDQTPVCEWHRTHTWSPTVPSDLEPPS